MPRTLPSNALSAILAQQTDQAFVVLLSITHEGVGSPLNITSDSVATTFNLVTYNPFPFDITMPTNEEGKVVEATLTIDNVGRDLIEQLRSQEVPMGVTIYIVASDDIAGGNATATFTDLVMRSIQYDALSISGRLTMEDFFSEPYPRDTFNPGLFPGLFVQGGTYDGDYTYNGPQLGCTQFDESNAILGAQPTDWTIPTEGAPLTLTTEGAGFTFDNAPDYAPSGNWLVADLGGYGVWEDTDQAADVEVLMEYNSWSATEDLGLIVRAQEGSPGALYEVHYALRFYDNFGTNGYFKFSKRVSGGGLSDLAGYPTDITLGAWQATGRKACVRFRVEGTSLKAKIWAGGEADEPDTPTTGWMVTATDSTIEGLGMVGLYQQQNWTQPVSKLAIAYEGETASFDCLPGGLGSGVATNFGEYTANQNLSDWTLEQGTGTFNAVTTDKFVFNNHTNEQHLEIVHANSGQRNMVTWDAFGTAEDVEVLAKFYYYSSNITAGVALRVQGTTSLDYYLFGINSSRIPKIWYISGSSDAVTIPTVLAPEITTLKGTHPILIRAKIVGTTLYMKCWTGSEAQEPEDWLYEEIDTNISGAGRVGIQGRATWSAGGGSKTRCDYFITNNGGAPVVPGQVGAPWALPSQFHDDFSTYTIGVQPTPYLERPNATFGDITVETFLGYEGGKALLISQGLQETCGAVLAAGHNSVNHEILAHLRVDYSERFGIYYQNTNGLYVRGNTCTGTDGDMQRYYAVCGYDNNTSAQTGLCRLRGWNGSTGVDLGEVWKHFVEHTMMFCRLRAHENTISVKWWQGGKNDEPATWDISVEHNYIPCGHPGMSTSVNNTRASNIYYDEIVMAYGGDTAVFPE